MGPDLFMKLAKINLKDVDDYLTPDQREQCIKTSRTTRNWKLLPRG